VQKLKKNYATIALLGLFIANFIMLGLPAPVEAQAQPEIYFDPAVYVGQQIGQEFNVTVKIRDVEIAHRAVGVQFRILYDMDLIEALNVYEGPFLQQFPNAPAGPPTFFTFFIEDDPVYGPNVLIGILLLPNGTGFWNDFPFGSGTLATVTFKVLHRPIEPTTIISNLALADTLIVDDALGDVVHTTSDAVYEALSISIPTLKIEPSTYDAYLIGETFEVNVTINDLDIDSRLVGVSFRVKYDSEVLQALTVVNGSFMQQFPNAPAPPYTYFISYIEDDPVVGWNVLVGILLLPNGTGFWTNFPFGSGTLATITFKGISQTGEPQPPASSALNLIDTEMINDTLIDLPHKVQNGYYEIAPLAFTYEPAMPIAGQPVMFTTLQANHSVTYDWDFGDGTTSTGEAVTHIYGSPGTYDVALTCTSDGFVSSPAIKTLQVIGTNKPTIDVTVDVGSMHFRGEIAEFNVLLTNQGEEVNATKIDAMLYYNNMIHADLTSSIQQIATGFYAIPYSLPVDAETGTYTLVVKAEYLNAKGVSIRTFQVSQTLTATITNIENDLATIITDLNTIKVNLTAINASITGIVVDSKGEILAEINSAIGTLTSRLDVIDATVTSIDGNVATISTRLGDVNVATKLEGIHSTATTTLYAASILSAIAVLLGLVILMFVRKK
jgi:PKD repeat protein